MNFVYVYVLVFKCTRLKRISVVVLKAKSGVSQKAQIT